MEWVAARVRHGHGDAGAAARRAVLSPAAGAARTRGTARRPVFACAGGQAVVHGRGVLLGVLVALVKLAHIASAIRRRPVCGWGALMLLLAAIAASFDAHAMGERLSAAIWGCSPAIVRAGVRSGPQGMAACARAAGDSHLRKRTQLARNWAYLIAALVPTSPNVLPIMETARCSAPSATPS